MQHTNQDLERPTDTKGDLATANPDLAVIARYRIILGIAVGLLLISVAIILMLVFRAGSVDRGTDSTNNQNEMNSGQTAEDDSGTNSDVLSPTREEKMIAYTVENATERNAVCNDGTPAVYFYRPGEGEGIDKWLVWFEGGGGCSSLESCDKRFEESKYLMSSSASGEGRVKEGGILSADTNDNPDFASWNHVMLNYCSSDTWMGDAIQTSSEREYIFAGHDIVSAIFKDLSDHNVFSRDLSDASELLVAGSSAGGSGASHNLNRIVDWFPELPIKGVIDSSWDPNDTTFTPFPFNDAEVVAFRGTHLDTYCSEALGTDLLDCVDLDALQPFWQVPVFIYIDQIDKVKLGNSGITDPSDPTQQSWILDNAELIRETLEEVDGYFSPAYGQHAVITNDWFNDSKIDGISFRQALGDWYFERTKDTQHLFSFTGERQTR